MPKRPSSHLVMGVVPAKERSYALFGGPTMRPYCASKERWIGKAIAGALVIFGLMSIGLSNSRAQMRYSGGFVPHYRHPTVFPGWGGTPPPAPTESSPPSYFPDNDSSYPYYNSVTPPDRRYYYPGAEAGRSMSVSGATAAMLPWNRAGFEEYDPFLETSPQKTYSAPAKYALEAAPLPVTSPAAGPEPALLIIHLPEHALLWVEGKSVHWKGQTSYYNSPALDPGKKYTYTVRVAWLEAGRWVSQIQKIPIEAGAIQALYLRRNALLK